jgi:hypothetical protein
MRANRLHTALAALGDAMREVNTAIEELRREHDPLAVSHLRLPPQLPERRIRKAAREVETAALLSWQSACDLGFRGTLGEWERLLGAAPRRD